ncbi:MAG: DinB family protein [Anaerolineaceae bacterium]|nr:DinB family protein [Anaerolineaceae bacterium]
MSESEHLAQALTDLLLEEENGWFLSVFPALEGLSAAQAAQSPGEKFNSPWAIVRHMTYWMTAVLYRLQELDPSTRLGEDWLPLSDPDSEEAWAMDKARLAEITRELADLVRRTDSDWLEQMYREGRPSRRQVIQGLIGHNCYHTNEIISMRHMLGYWLDQT